MMKKKKWSIKKIAILIFAVLFIAGYIKYKKEMEIENYYGRASLALYDGLYVNAIENFNKSSGLLTD